MEKIAIKLTKEVKKVIRERFGTKHYDNDNEHCYFHYPNVEDYKGFLEGQHSFSVVEDEYKEVNYAEFIIYLDRLLNRLDDYSEITKAIELLKSKGYKVLKQSWEEL